MENMILGLVVVAINLLALLMPDISLGWATLVGACSGAMLFGFGLREYLVERYR